MTNHPAVSWDTEIFAQTRPGQRAMLLDRNGVARIDEGMRSPRWLPCRGCGATKGCDCNRGDGRAAEGFCERRILDNVDRLLNLPTRAVAWTSPCCERRVWLVWRQLEDALTWQEVPCLRCKKTYTVQRYASDIAPDDRLDCDRINPLAVEMTCWASEE